MNKSSIKNFAVTARIKLLGAIEQKAYELGITKKGIKEPEVYKDGFRVNDNFFKKYQMKQREKLIQNIKDQGFDQVIEEVAYTWFNRFIAIRFMEVNEYLPTGLRVLSSVDSGKIEPDAVSDVLTIAEDLELDLDVVYRLQDENNSEELFKYIFVKQCNKLGEIMPVIFEQIEDYTELLLPENLLTEGSVIRDLVTFIQEDEWRDQVEIIGWLYQYYISEKKEHVFGDLKKGKKITKENIPPATQLFTPEWIVKYMTENSLGRLWLQSRPDKELQDELEYYLEDIEQGQEVNNQLEKLTNRNLSPQDIKVFDPSMGSGHMLVYAFDLLYKIYSRSGYSEREIPQLILENNLFGLDIDDRAAQLAYFALLMKARSYNRRIFRKNIKMNLYSIKESNGIPHEALDYLVNRDGLEIEKAIKREEVEYIVNVFKDAKEYGSILDIKSIDFDSIENKINLLENEISSDIFEEQYKDILIEKIPSLIEQARLLSQKYDVVITNPPYMGNKGMSPKLTDYLKENYPNSKYDLFSVFIERCMDFTKENKFFSMITMESWMFLSRFEILRKRIMETGSLINMVHMPYEGKGRTSLGINFGTVSFIALKKSIPNFLGGHSCIRYSDIDNEGVPFKFPTINSRYGYSPMERYKAIPGNPFAYWVTSEYERIFKSDLNIGNFGEAREGMATAKNDYFLKFWHEVSFENIGFNYKNRQEAKESQKKWFPYNKGGKFRRWYGNNEYVVNWFNDGDEIRNFKDEKTGRIRSHNYNLDFIFKEGITWSSLTSSVFSCRYSEVGKLSDSKGPTLYITSDERYVNYIFGFLNTQIAQNLLDLTAPGMDYKVGDISELPLIINENLIDKVNSLVSKCIKISKEDWDSFETSWGFSKHPILKYRNDSNKLEEAFNNWDIIAQKRCNDLKDLEKEINLTFYEIYGLKNVVDIEIDENDISIEKANKERDIKSFISYSIGCLFGRYSVDNDGMIVVNRDLDKRKFNSLNVDGENIIPITDDEYFEDDIVSRFIEFIRTTFGIDTLEENLNFIADALTKKSTETARQRIRRYLVKEFYKDHVQIYQKRPIYWLFDSGKNDGFKALIYMHRYDNGTAAKIRTDYLHALQRKYEAEIIRQDLIQEADISSQEKTKAKKQKEKLQKQLLECQQYDQVIAHVAHKKIDIDLDEGVKVNYEKFQNVEVPQGEGKKALNANLLAKI